MIKFFCALLLVLSLPILAQVNPQGKILSCKWQVDQEESFLIILQRKPMSQQLGNYSESRIEGKGGKIVRSYNSFPFLELNPAQCILRVSNSKFSISTHKLNYELSIEDNEFRVTELSGFGPNIDDQSFICEISDKNVISKLKDECARHATNDGFIPVNNNFKLDTKFISDASIQKEMNTSSTVSPVNLQASPQ